jgi:hypothetical protein
MKYGRREYNPCVLLTVGSNTRCPLNHMARLEKSKNINERNRTSFTCLQIK